MRNFIDHSERYGITFVKKRSWDLTGLFLKEKNTKILLITAILILTIILFLKIDSFYKFNDFIEIFSEIHPFLFLLLLVVH